MCSGQPGRLLWLAFLTLSGTAAVPLRDTYHDPAGQFQAAVDWVSREITAVGRARVTPGTPTAHLERAATLDAYRHLAAAARRARVDTRRLVEDVAAADREFATRFVAIVRGAELARLEVTGDWATIRARLPLYSTRPASASLGKLVYQRPDVYSPEVAAPDQPNPGGHTGLLLDGRDLPLAGLFAPVVTDESGRVVWHIESTPLALAEQDGAVDYQGDWEQATSGGRCGDRPLIIPLLAVHEDGGLVVSDGDGRRLAGLAVQGRSDGIAWANWCEWLPIRPITPVSPFTRTTVVGGPRRTSATTGHVEPEA